MDVVSVQCATPGCGHSPFPMSSEFVFRAQRTGEGFHCPAGHSLTYGEGTDKKERRKLREQIERYEAQIDRLNEEIMLAYRTCRWIGCGFVSSSDGRHSHQGLHRHMRAVHGMPTLAQIAEVA